MVLGNLIELSLTQARQQQRAEEDLRTKANSLEIAGLIQRVTENLYRDLGSLSPVKRASAKFEARNLEQETELPDVSGIKLRQSLAGFADSVEIMSGTVLKLNQARCEAERRIFALESARVEAVSRSFLRTELNSAKEEMQARVRVFACEDLVDKGTHGRNKRRGREAGEKLRGAESRLREKGHRHGGPDALAAEGLSGAHEISRLRRVRRLQAAELRPGTVCGRIFSSQYGG